MAVKKDPVTGTPKQRPQAMSPKDRTATITHLAETVSYNSKHSLNHAKAAARIAARMAKKYPKEPDFATLLHNTQHTAKHAGDVEDHSKRMIEHLRTYPGSDAAYKELMNPRPSDVAAPTKKNARPRK